jgi:hypothetical protein
MGPRPLGAYALIALLIGFFAWLACGARAA